MRRKLIGVIVWVACVTAMQAQQQRSPWSGATRGAIPDGAIAYGREADGREQFACRGLYGGGMHLGKIASGFAGCNIGYGGREVTLPDYEVLVRPRRRDPIDDVLSAAAIAMGESRGARRASSQAASVPPSPPEAAKKRGIDENGEPYVDEQLADGTTKRTQTDRVTLIKPDGTREIHQLTMMNAPMPTPPELPGDPSQGRVWVERHNEQLLAMIRSLVNNDAAEMKKFTDAERRATSDDVFAQIAHRTEVATFLAQQR